MKVLYSALYNDGYPFDSLADKVEVAETPDDLKEKDSLLVVWGGSDISPSLYNHEASRTTSPAPVRDAKEWALMKRAVEMGIPIIGVCRGAQMLCALAGGYLIQDVGGHHGRHSINTINGDVLMVNSIHHQMQEPSMTDHEVLAWCEEPLSKRYIIRDDRKWTPPEGWQEPEFVYYRKVQGFAIQWHPEMMAENAPATEFVLNTIKEKLCLNTTMTCAC